jgi:putative methionine-R-sulfoxide reductase with GAF domain
VDFLIFLPTFTLSHFHTFTLVTIFLSSFMAEDLTLTQGLTRAERYQELLPQIEGVISAESDLIANLANVAAILKEGLGFFWVGFYRMMEGELVLGPFQGPLACTRIALDRGCVAPAPHSAKPSSYRMWRNFPATLPAAAFRALKSSCR